MSRLDQHFFLQSLCRDKTKTISESQFWDKTKAFYLWLDYWVLYEYFHFTQYIKYNMNEAKLEYVSFEDVTIDHHLFVFNDDDSEIWIWMRMDEEAWSGEIFSE